MEFPKRKPNRLKAYDYSQNGAYFVTVCTKDRKNLFWNVGEAISLPKNNIPLSEYGKIAEHVIRSISKHYIGVEVSQYVIMPNHIHFILILKGDDGQMISAPTVSTIIGQAKRYISKQIGLPIWQKSFHDRIIRNEKEYQKIWEYLETNPLKWEEDCFYRQES